MSETPYYGPFTDSAGVSVIYTPIEDVKPGSGVVGGWDPPAVVRRVEIESYRARLVYDHGTTEWFPLGEAIPVARPCQELDTE